MKTSLLVVGFLVVVFAGCRRSDDRKSDAPGAADAPAAAVAHEATDAPEARDSRYAACKRWGKSDDYIQGLSAQYAQIRAAEVPEKEVRSSAVDACQERIADEDELADCRACMEEIVREVYRD